MRAFFLGSSQHAAKMGYNHNMSTGSKDPALAFAVAGLVGAFVIYTIIDIIKNKRG